MDIGEKWAYRERAYTPGAPVLPVEILQFGPRRSQKVRIKFLDGEYRGLDLWVPQVRLQVPWDEAGAWLEDEQRLTAVSEASQEAYESIEHRAADEVFAAYPRPDGILSGYRPGEGALVRVADLATTAADLGLDPEELRSAPLAFEDRFGEFVAPWPVTEQPARCVAEVYTEAVLARVRAQERELQEGTVYGQVVEHGRGKSFTIRPERCEELLREEQPVFDLIRSWCGAPAVARFDELEALRGSSSGYAGWSEVVRWLEPHHPRIAGRLRNQLDRPDR